MAEVVARAVELRLRSEPRGARRSRVDGAVRVRVREREVRELLEEMRASRPPAAARERFRMALVRRFYGEYGRLLGGAAFRDFDEVERALGERLPDALPRRRGRRRRRTRSSAAAHRARARRGGRRILDADEQRLSCAAAARGWSVHDLPLLDEARRARRRAAAAVRPRDRRRGAGSDADAAAHVARRRANGALTMLGDIAQGDRPGRVQSWEEVGRAPARRRRRGRRGAPPRLPRPARDHGFALPLLDAIAPRRRAAARLPQGGEPPTVRRVAEGDLLAEALARGRRLALETGCSP